MTSETIKDGGPAFPKPLDPYPNAQGVESGTHGMSLRDWFAGQALVGLIAYPGKIYGKDNLSYEEAALFSFDLADAMLKAREAQS